MRDRKRDKVSGERDANDITSNLFFSIILFADDKSETQTSLFRGHFKISINKTAKTQPDKSD